MAKKTSPTDQDRLRSWFEDLLIDGSLPSFVQHAGMDVAGPSPDACWHQFRDHYSRDGRIDESAFARDLATWGPIASRVVELQIERRDTQ